MTTPQPTNLERVREFVELLQHGNFDEAEKILAPNFTIHEPQALPYGGDLHGHEGWETFRTMFRKTWKNWKDSPIWYGEVDGTVIKENTITATSRLTDKTCTTNLAEFFTLEDGRITEARVYYQNLHAVLTALTPDVADNERE